MAINWAKVTCEDVTPPDQFFLGVDHGSKDYSVEIALRRELDGALTVVDFTMIDDHDRECPDDECGKE